MFVSTRLAKDLKTLSGLTRLEPPDLIVLRSGLPILRSSYSWASSRLDEDFKAFLLDAVAAFDFMVLIRSGELFLAKSIFINLCDDYVLGSLAVFVWYLGAFRLGAFSFSVRFRGSLLASLSFALFNLVYLILFRILSLFWISFCILFSSFNASESCSRSSIFLFSSKSFLLRSC